MNNLKFRRATVEDSDKIFALYESVKGGEFCTWNEFYPGREEIDCDIANQSLYLMTDGERIVAAVSVVPECELDELKCWMQKDNAKEIARVAVAPECQGQGLAYSAVTLVEEVLKNSGCRAVHLLVAKKNIPAYKTYIKEGYTVLDSVFMYGNDYFACEKIL